MHRVCALQSRSVATRFGSPLINGHGRACLLLVRHNSSTTTNNKNGGVEARTAGRSVQNRGFATVQENHGKMPGKQKQLQRVALSKPEEVIKVLEQDGGVILTGFATPEQVEKVNEDARPYINAPTDDRAEFFLPKDTTRCTRLFGRSETAREVWMQNPQLSQILHHFLTTTAKVYQTATEEDTDIEEWSTYPILSSSMTFNIGPGGKEQFLHRDDELWQHKHTDTTEYQMGRDIGMGIIVPGVKTTEENGATLCIPGSHLWADEQRGNRDDAIPVEMDVGEGFMFLSSIIHAGGANKTQVARPAHGFFFCRWYLRPEENQYLWWKKAEVQSWSEGAQKQVGYVLDNPILGHCDFTNPLDKFRVSGEDDQAM